MLFDDKRTRHVGSLDHDLMLHEKPHDELARMESRHGAFVPDGQHGGYEQHERTSSPIVLKDILRGEVKKPHGVREEVRHVLLYGNPGVGKTCIGKKIAYEWACRKWGDKFCAVYFLPLRSIRAVEYDGDSNKQRTIETAITNICFSFKHEDHELNVLKSQVLDDLSKPSTLLILDGLDEEDAPGKEMIAEGLNSEAKVLLLSRPMVLDRELKEVDRAIECGGLTDSQLEQFIASVFPGKDGRNLASQLSENETLWGFMHMPVVANILCAMWVSAQVDRQDLNASNHHEIYAKMVNYLWERHAHKGEDLVSDCRKVFDSLGSIAFKALRLKQVSIDKDLFLDEISKIRLKMILRETGFLLFNKERDSYEFLHLTFQEYFAGQFLARSMRCDAVKEWTKRFVSNNKYCTRYKVVFEFFVHEMCTQLGAGVFDHALPCIDMGIRDLLGVQHYLLHLQILEVFLTVEKEQERRHAISHHAVKKIISIANSLPVLFASNHRLKDAASLIYEKLACSTKILENFPELFDVVEIILLFDEEFRTFLEYACRVTKKEIKATPRTMSFIHRRKHPKNMTTVLLEERVFVSFNVSTQEQERLQIASSLCTARSKLVRGKAVVALGSIVEESPTCAEEAARVATERCGDYDWKVRMAAMGALMRIAMASPERAGEAAQAAVKQLADRSFNVRALARMSLDRIAKTSPEAVREVVAVFCERSDADDLNVRAADDDDLNLRDVAERCADEDGGVRAAALATLATIVAANPDCGGEALPIAVERCADDDGSVRAAALAALATIVAAIPMGVGNAMRIVAERCNDDDWSVRWAAVKALGKLLRSIPATAKALMTLGPNLSNDNEEDFFLRVEHWHCFSLRDLTKLGLLFPVKSVAAQMCIRLTRVSVTVVSWDEEHVTLTFHETAPHELKARKGPFRRLIAMIKEETKTEHPFLMDFAHLAAN